jgi:hypothetical protein
MTGGEVNGLVAPRVAQDTWHGMASAQGIGLLIKIQGREASAGFIVELCAWKSKLF